MTDHAHSQYVEGCFRCDLSRDEVASGYVTEAMVEKAGQALHDHRSMECRALHEVGQPLRDTVYDNERRADARAALEAVVPGIVQAAKVEAWDEGHAAGCTDPYARYGECGCGPNPYRERGES